MDFHHTCAPYTPMPADVGAAAPGKLRDREIRAIIKFALIDPILRESRSRLVEEMPICLGEARVDLAVINGQLHGFEIKSEADTLERLPKQVSAYGRVFDTMTLITFDRHLETVQAMVPSWWAIYSINATRNLECFHHGTGNIQIDAIAIAQLLWKPELLEILERVYPEKAKVYLPRRKLWEFVAAACPTIELQELVRQRLLTRRCWRFDAPQM